MQLSRRFQRPTGGGVALAACLAVALALRTATTALLPNQIWPDEVFQTVEPAHGLAFGTWLPSWEWVVGIRSWLVPGLLMPELWIGDLLDPGLHFGTAPVTAVMLLLSLIPVIVGYLWGERTGGPAGGLVVGGVCAVWVDLVYLAPHPLTDIFASHTLLLALYAAFAVPQSHGARRLFLAGALLGLSVYLRMQLGPVAAVVAVFASGTKPMRWRALLIGGGATVALLGGVDWVTLGTPFQSIWLNFYYNIIAKVSSTYGTESPLFYFRGLLAVWGPAAPFILVLAYFGARRWPQLFWVSFTIIVTQSMVAHKEWRFIFPAIAPMIILCSLQIVACLPRIEARFGLSGLGKAAPVVICLAATAAISAIGSSSPIYRAFWTRDRPVIKAFNFVARQGGVCGVGILFPLERKDTPQTYDWVGGMGSAALPRGTPQYAAVPTANGTSRSSYNWAVIDRLAPSPPAPFHRVKCFGDDSGQSGPDAGLACVWTRTGGCDASTAVQPAINWPAYFVDDRGQVRKDRLQPRVLGMTPPLHLFGKAL